MALRDGQQWDVPSLWLQRVPPNFCGCLSKPPASPGDASLEETSALCVKYHSGTSHSQSIQIPGGKPGGRLHGFGGPLGAPCFGCTRSGPAMTSRGFCSYCSSLILQRQGNLERAYREEHDGKIADEAFGSFFSLGLVLPVPCQ